MDLLILFFTRSHFLRLLVTAEETRSFMKRRDKDGLRPKQTDVRILHFFTTPDE